MKQKLVGLWLLALAVISFSSCISDKGNAEDIFTKIYSRDSIPAQFFLIDPSRDTTIKGRSGTIVRIYKNSFLDTIGKPVHDSISFEFKEVVSTLDIVLGNLTTTSNGKYLESGGMFYFNATLQGSRLRLANDKSIGVIVPRKLSAKEMEIFEAEKDSAGINWVNPKPLLNAQIKRKEFDNVTITWFPPENTEKAEENAIGETLLKEFRNVQQDTMVVIDNKKVQMLKPIKGDVFIDSSQGNDNRLMSEILVPKGTNFFLEDYNSNYIFSIKQLGWANIDRLYEDPRTREIKLSTIVINVDEFKRIYVSMIVNNKKMYIPGYQKKDNSFSFTHNDEEPVSLPVGENAIILATAYKKGKPFIAIQKITIAPSQTVSLELRETTLEKLKARLNAEL